MTDGLKGRQRQSLKILLAQWKTKKAIVLFFVYACVRDESQSSGIRPLKFCTCRSHWAFYGKKRTLKNNGTVRHVISDLGPRRTVHCE